MVLVEPCGLIAAQKGEESPAAQFGAGGISEEGAAAAGTDERINLGDQFAG
ncbi:MAG: hypothetical protein M3O31_11630 [Acidobacteriota bacterium]|nr:hypothetical protein [Acidobacteriota bacterium]